MPREGLDERRDKMENSVKKAIIVMLAGNHTIANIMSATGEKPAAIRKVAKEAGIEITRHPQKVTDEMRSNVVRMHESGWTTANIVSDTKLGYSTVNRIIKESKTVQTEKTQHEKQLQLPIPVCNEIKEIPLEALRMIRDALDIIIEARLT